MTLAGKFGVELGRKYTKNIIANTVIGSEHFTIHGLLNLLTIPELRKIAGQYEVSVSERRKEYFISAIQERFEENKNKKTFALKKDRPEKPLGHDSETQIIEDKLDKVTCENAERFRWRHRPQCPFCNCELKDENTFVRHVTSKCPKLHGHDASGLSNDAKTKALDILRSKIDFEAVNIVESKANNRSQSKSLRRSVPKRSPSKSLRKNVPKRRKKKKLEKKYNEGSLFPGRALPRRVTSMVSGGLPSLGRKR